MSSIPETIAQSGTTRPAEAFFGYNNVTDYILGITFEIWEQGQVEKILDYYADEIDVYTMEGLSHGAASMVKGTHAMLNAFPDRLLLGDGIIWSGNLSRGFSSHRIISPMTNRGETAFAPATDKRIVAMNIADCEITNGKITREWLFRDNVSVLGQLGLDPIQAARTIAERVDPTHRSWLKQEFDRVRGGKTRSVTIGMKDTDPFTEMAEEVIESLWTGANHELQRSCYAAYAVLNRAPVRIHSGRDAVIDHYAEWRAALPDARIAIDHVCSQPFDENGHHVAVRWSVAGHQEGPMSGLAATGKPVYLVGCTHWRILDGVILKEWTVFDEVGLASQVLDPHN
jgi:predicted ester cyclase